MGLLTRDLIQKQLSGQEDAWERGFVKTANGEMISLADYESDLEEFEMENMRMSNYI